MSFEFWWAKVRRMCGMFQKKIGGVSGATFGLSIKKVDVQQEFVKFGKVTIFRE